MTMRVPLTAILAAASLAVIAAACLIGSTPMAPGRAILGLLGIGGTVDALADQVIVRDIRLPRALAAWMVGAALGASGAALQGLLRNPLAEPGVLGVSAAAALGAVATLVFGTAALPAILAPWALPLAAVGGAMAATALLAVAAARLRSVVTLILVGVGLSSFCGALMSLMMNLAPNPFTLAEMINWMLGSVANRSMADLGFAAPFMALGAWALAARRRDLTALTLGEEAAAGIGADLGRTRIMIVLGAGLLTGAAVALAGAIGFVGIVAPHLVRPLVGHDPARALLPSALLAGVILVLADIGVRLAPGAAELNLGVLAALLGAPAFAWIAARRSGRHG
ncbi:MAG: iron complex transport system permease protein [Paracoccaceae bacterium]|jgi:iron complex transport system permease protein